VAKKSNEHLTFGVEPSMREVPPGTDAEFTLGETKEWQIVETEWGTKYSFPIVLLSHPSYDNIPTSGLKMDWQSKSKAAEGLFYWMYDETKLTVADQHTPQLRTWDIDMSKELNGIFKLHRGESGSYLIEVMG